MNDFYAEMGSYLAVPFTATALIYFNRRGKKTRLAHVVRYMLHPKIWLNNSTLLDFKYALASVFIFSQILLYTVISTSLIGRFVTHRIADHFGPVSWSVDSKALCIAIMTAVLYLVYEFTYWAHHYLCHKIPFFWEFHKVHHSAKVLTPFTNWRVHVVNLITFSNAAAITQGLAQGVIIYFLGNDIGLTATIGSTLVLNVFLGLYGHIQHSHIWLPVTGWAGRIIYSPAHHQIHHSTNPVHYNKNMGLSLAVFDWIFGTLHIPSKQNERLTFGVEDGHHLQYFLMSTLYPIYRAFRQLVRNPLRALGWPQPARRKNGLALPVYETNLVLPQNMED